MRGEIWKPIPGFPRYYASNLGRIQGPWRVLSAYARGDGRWVVGVSPYGPISVGRLVCLAFHGEAPPGKPWALHRDDNTRNNRPDNLYWGNGADNQNDAKSNGKRYKRPAYLRASKKRLTAQRA